jgi:hypothetical protein
MAKYLNASKEIASHAVLLPEGFRFSRHATTRDWTDESLARLRAFYHQFTPDGSLPLRPYVAALVQHRAQLHAGKVTFSEIAADQKLSPKYLQALWQAFHSEEPSYPLDQIRAIWRTDGEEQTGQIVAAVDTWRDPLWNFVNIGSYRDGHTARQIPQPPTIHESASLKVALQPEPGQSEVVLYLAARDLLAPPGAGHVIWQRPRFETVDGDPLLLRDYPEFGPGYEIDYAGLFASTAEYLAAVVEAANNPQLTTEDLAEKHGLDKRWLVRWIEVAAVKPFADRKDPVVDRWPSNCSTNKQRTLSSLTCKAGEPRERTCPCWSPTPRIAR